MISAEVLTVCGAFIQRPLNLRILILERGRHVHLASATPHVPRVHETSTTTWTCLGELDEFWRDGVPVHASQKLFGVIDVQEVRQSVAMHLPTVLMTYKNLLRLEPIHGDGRFRTLREICHGTQSNSCGLNAGF